jgi:hypothetical protein
LISAETLQSRPVAVCDLEERSHGYGRELFQMFRANVSGADARPRLTGGHIDGKASPMLYRHSEATVALLRRAPVIPVLTVKDVEDALVQARALIAGG